MSKDQEGNLGSISVAALFSPALLCAPKSAISWGQRVDTVLDLTQLLFGRVEVIKATNVNYLSGLPKRYRNR